MRNRVDRSRIIHIFPFRRFSREMAPFWPNNQPADRFDRYDQGRRLIQPKGGKKISKVLVLFVGGGGNATISTQWQPDNYAHVMDYYQPIMDGAGFGR